MTQETGFRVFGDVLDREESYLDVSVSGVDEDGDIYLAEGGQGGETWEFDAEEIADLHDDLLAVGQSKIPFPEHGIWTDLDNIGDTRKEVDINQWVDNHLLESQRHLFKAILEAGR